MKIDGFTLQAYRIGPDSKPDLSQPVEIGDTVTDFRGDSGVLVALERGREAGRTGKVAVQRPGHDLVSYTYDYVWDLAVIGVPNDPSLRAMGADTEECGECQAPVPGVGDVINEFHSRSCSLYPGNVI